MIDIMIQNIYQLNATVQIMQSQIATYLKRETNISSNRTESPSFIIVPSSEEIDRHRGEFTSLEIA